MLNAKAETVQSQRLQNRVSVVDVISLREIAHYTQQDYVESKGKTFFVIPQSVYSLRKKLDSQSVPLGKVARVSFGLRTGDDSLFLKTKLTHPQDRKLVASKSIGRYSISTIY